MIGQTLSHFEITAKLGEGGMGVVYQAHDSVLDRDVAIKVLPERLAKNPERLTRLQREARVLASLNHPNIAAVYSFETAKPQGDTKEQFASATIDPVAFLVMELVDGETGSELIAKGPIPVERSLEIALEVCRGLEAAHESDVVHRDLKPANLKIDASDRVKILDFGLAKALASADSGLDEVAIASASPTLTADMTEEGAVLGTAAYMSPEQAVGGPLDKRSDIWSFGCLLYEMLTGEQAFRGPTNAETLASILRAEPDLERLPNSMSPAIAHLLERCLQKDPLRRMRDIGEARILLEDVRSGTVPFPSHESSEGKRAATWLPWLVAAAAVLVATIAFLRPGDVETPSPTGVKRLSISLPAQAPFLPIERSALAISPDGSQIVFVGGSKSDFRLYSRDLTESEVVALEQTQGGESPIFSPDGAWITFASTVSLRKLPVTGGSAQDLSFAPPVTRGFEWLDDNAILMSPNKASGLFEISLDDRKIKELTRRGSELLSGHCWPQLLPGGTQALAASLPANVSSWDGAVILLLDLESGTSRKLIEGGSFPRYVPSGHIVFARDGSLFANPFDISTGRLLGSSTVVIPDLLTDPTSGVAHFAFSNDGTLVYAHGGSRPSSMRDLVWVDRNGIEERISSEPRAYAYPRLSTSGEQVLMTIEGATDNVWTFDLGRGVLQRVTIVGRQMTPLWGPDPDSITYASVTKNFPAATIRSLHDNSSHSIEGIPEPSFPSSWSPDGGTLAYAKLKGFGSYDVCLAEPGNPEHCLFDSPFNESAPTISPDGRSLAFVSDESGRYEVYVSRFPSGSERVQVSTLGGVEPIWSPDGRSLYYRSGRGLYEVPMQGDRELSFEAARLLFEGDFAGDADVPGFPFYDLAADGEHFLMLQEEPTPVIVELQVVVNWFEELRRLAPAP